jgi:hypothetical protein
MRADVGLRVLPAPEESAFNPAKLTEYPLSAFETVNEEGAEAP